MDSIFDVLKFFLQLAQIEVTRIQASSKELYVVSDLPRGIMLFHCHLVGDDWQQSSNVETACIDEPGAAYRVTRATFVPEN
jgi:hypothetical protein